MTVAQEDFPFFESGEAATKHAIQASGRKFKEIGAALWPSKTPERAGVDLANALNEQRDERLTTEQHIFIARFVNRYDWLYYACQQLSHERPALQTPAEEAQRLQEALFSKTDELRALLNQVDALKPKLRAAG